MEIISIIYIFSFGRLNYSLQCSKIVFIEFVSIFRCESVLYRMLESLLIFSVDCFSCCFCKTLSIQVLTRYLWDVSCIAWNMLSLDILCRTTDPFFACKRGITILESFIQNIFLRRTNVEISLLKVWLANCYIDIVFGWLLFLFSKKTVNVSCCASIYFILFWYVTCVTRQVLFVILNECFRSHFLKLPISL